MSQLSIVLDGRSLSPAREVEPSPTPLLHTKYGNVHLREEIAREEAGLVLLVCGAFLVMVLIIMDQRFIGGTTVPFRDVF